MTIDLTRPTPAGSSEAADADGVFRIWPGDGAAPGSEGWDWSERTADVPWTPSASRRYARNVVVPTITAFLPDPAKATGAAMIVAPGGAFHFLMMDHEGYDVARWLTKRGIASFVLKYRLARTPDDDAEMEIFRTQLQKRLGRARPGDTDPPSREGAEQVRTLGDEDGRQAIRYVRSRAAEWGIDPHRVGTIGFSAGGGVVMGGAFSYDDDSRPDFVAAIYPAWRLGTPVPADAPPLFLVIADDDMAVPPISSARLYEAWHKAQRPVELHIFGSGAHGFGMARGGHLSDAWLDLLANWLSAQGAMVRAGEARR